MYKKLLEKIIYPFMYFVRRERVSTFVKLYEESQWNSINIIENNQFEKIKELIQYHAINSKTYSQFLIKNGVSTNLSTIADFEKIPIMEKSDVNNFLVDAKKNYSSFGSYTVRLTGGSSGVPAVVFVDPECSARSLAARIVCQGWHGVKPSDRQIRLWGRPLVSGRTKAFLKDLLLNRIRLNSQSFEEIKINKTIKKLIKSKPDYIYGYASLIQLVSDKINDKNLKQIFKNIKCVISTSETMSIKQQKAISEKFKCPVVDEYGCSEVDIIAFECPSGSKHIVSDNVFIEIIRFGDEPDGYGQVVITDLNNKLMPMIRYRLGDLVSVEKIKCSCGRGWPCLGRIIGRSQGQYIFSPGKGMVHSQYVVYIIEELVFKGFPIEIFKIIQSDNYNLKIILGLKEGTDLDLGEVSTYFKNESKHVLGEGLICNFEIASVDTMRKDLKNKFCHFESQI
ncbi:phenylacetate--CoA ligase family protein [Desulfuromonas sp. AOP6]|uniref:phenylacetate--CoA ligase family protein n=1 Tax=Desulfuromonas sp. AOP6 TaxID=1566351 RepID=UPI00127BC7D7|nr:phenylacetate--CoA ligase family protein [Desulfuromonas sp. AOP6]BCA79503.1 adenylyltransferase [Desulfuromonas sp. AOP6]